MSNQLINSDNSQRELNPLEKNVNTSSTRIDINRKIGVKPTKQTSEDKIKDISLSNRKVHKNKIDAKKVKLITDGQNFTKREYGQNIPNKKILSNYDTDIEKLNQSITLTSGRNRLTISHTNDYNENEQENTVKSGRPYLNNKQDPDNPDPLSQSMFIATGPKTNDGKNQDNTFNRIAKEFPEYK